MCEKDGLTNREAGVTLLELCIVFTGAIIILGLSVPVVTTTVNEYRLMLSAQNIVTELQFARMKAVSSNESFRVNFPAGQRSYQVETAGGAVVAGPFFLPTGINWNTIDAGQAVTFGGRFVAFSPTGDVPGVGNGSAGRVKIINPRGIRIDIVVGTGGIVRETPAYDHPPAAF